VSHARGMRCRLRALAPGAGLIRVALIWASAGGGWSARAEAPAGLRPAEIVQTWVVPPVPLAAGPVTVPLGGVSDLFPAGPLDALTRPGGEAELWAITDRGPNGTVKVHGEKRRTLTAPQFVPAIVRLRLRRAPAAGSGAFVEEVIRLRGRSGKAMTGLPNGLANDVVIHDVTGAAPLPPDPNGIDTEGLVVMADGSYWVAEEYRPSLLHVAADGTVQARHVPHGGRIDGADMEVIESLPATWAGRRDNRGFEGLALSPADGRLWALLQSPLPDDAATGDVRLLGFDPGTGRSRGEQIYRLGDPEDPGFATTGAPPRDGKLCAMAWCGGRHLLVIEQDDESTLCRLYAVEVASEEIAGESPPDDAGRGAGRFLPKRLVADLEPLYAEMRAAVRGSTPGEHGRSTPGKPKSPPLKIEGLAIVDDRHVLLVNDNDFSIDVKPGQPAANTCVWLMRLAEPLWP